MEIVKETVVWLAMIVVFVTACLLSGFVWGYLLDGTAAVVAVILTGGLIGWTSALWISDRAYDD